MNEIRRQPSRRKAAKKMRGVHNRRPFAEEKVETIALVSIARSHTRRESTETLARNANARIAVN